jgi:hypothetical protein
MLLSTYFYHDQREMVSDCEFRRLGRVCELAKMEEKRQEEQVEKAVSR